MTDDIGALLQHLWILNEKDDVRQHGRRPAIRQAGSLPSIRRSRWLSPMLRARYAFADAWHGAAHGQTWLAMGAVMTASALLRERA